jgi:hypothetical protein
MRSSRPRRRPSPGSIAAISLGFIALGTAPARANPEAEAMFDEGVKLFNAGKIGEACDAFEASNTIEARAGTLVRLGECREKNHQLASAWSAYKDALVRVKDPKKKAFATKRVAELEPKLSYLTVSVPPEARIDGLAITRNDKPIESVLWNRAVPVDGGSYTIVARAPNRTEWKTTATVPEQAGKITVDVKPLEEIKIVKPPPPKPEPLEKPEPEPTPVAHGGLTSKRVAAIGIGAGAIAFVGVATIMGVIAKHDQSLANTDCPDPSVPCTGAVHANALLHSGHQLAIGADVAFAVSGAAAVAAGLLWTFGGSKEHARVAIAPALGGFVVAGRF